MADATQEQCEEQREDVLDASERRSEGGQDDRMDVDKPEGAAMETAPSGADVSQQGRPSSRKPQVEDEEGEEKPPQPSEPAHCPPNGEGEGLSAGTHVGPVGEDGVGSGKVGEVEDENEVEDSMLEQLQNEYEGEINQWHARPDAASAEAMWRQFELRTSALAQELSEQLRLILEATVASKLQGDYRTGKRISMRKVIPYIASGFRKDKIWLRRTKPSKREYQVMLCIDDSESMQHTGAGTLACEALAVICQALSRVEVGRIARCSYLLPSLPSLSPPPPHPFHLTVQPSTTT